MTFIFLIFFALYTNSFVRSFASSVNITGSSLVDGCDCDKSEDYLITPALDLSGVESAILAFSSYYDGGSYEGDDEVATVEYSLDGGSTWTLLQTLEGSEGTWDFEVIDLDVVLAIQDDQSYITHFH